ncbi:AAA family ATPase [Streptacidiphilus albus]|uniref:AAA family ATPase n=1 Tax=Streptacidiphilus albus TaxID=105425 RepID=UPI00068D1912|nr:AAA family ATPase [Streptacidiphilus albus]
MSTFAFSPATREQARARIGLQGPAGSGKTKSSLRIAEGLAQGGLIGVIDTERGSALTYAPVPGKPELGGHVFGHMPMDNHDPRNLIEAVHVAEQASLAVLIVDSWSHFWNGKGGLLAIVDEAGRKPGAGGSFGGWRDGNPIEQAMLDALLNFSGHVIVTMRTKGDYAIEGKKVTKLGVKAVQREGAEYELGLILDMVEGTGTVTKTRYEPLEGLTVHHPGEELAAVILEQLGHGIDPVQPIVDELTAAGLTYASALSLYARAGQRGLHSALVAHPVSKERLQLGKLIKEYGSALKPGAVAPTRPERASARIAAEPTDAELYAALQSGHPDVEDSAADMLAGRGRLPLPAARPRQLPYGSRPSAHPASAPPEHDYVADAVNALDADAVEHVWNLASAAGAGQDTLDQISQLGWDKARAAMERAADDIALPLAELAEAFKGTFNMPIAHGSVAAFQEMTTNLRRSAAA